jgi:hypothetical protein
MTNNISENQNLPQAGLLENEHPQLEKETPKPVNESSNAPESPNAGNENSGVKEAGNPQSEKIKDSVFRDRPPFIAGMSKLMPTGDLAPHPINSGIYGNDLDNAFVEAVKRNGVYSPLLITTDGKVISGNRRLAAAIQAGIRELSVVIFDSSDELDIYEAVVLANGQREKNNEQKAREFKLLLKVQSERARQHMGRGVENLPPDMKGKARDIAAAKIGISGRTAEKAAMVVEKIDQLVTDGKSEKAEELRKVLTKSVDGAFKKLHVLVCEEKYGTPAASNDEGQETAGTVEGESKSEIITRIQEDLVEGTEVWAIEKLRNYEVALKASRETFETENDGEKEGA